MMSKSSESENGGRIALYLSLLICYVLISPTALAQAPSARPEFGELSRQSQVIVVGVVEGVFFVVRSDQSISQAKPLPNGNVVVELRNPNDYVVGRLVKLRVKEVLKSNGRIRAGALVNVFLRGPYHVEGQPVLAEKERYVVFLSPLDVGTDEFKNTVVHEPRPSSGKDRQFAPRSSYQVIGNGAISVSTRDNKVVNEIRAALRDPRR